MATTGGLDTNKFTKGPGLLYLDSDIPGADAALVLTAGVPAAGHCVGYTTEGNEISWGRESEAVNADETSAAIEQVISAETLTISGTAYQLEDVVLLQHLLGTGTYADKSTYDLLKFGGLTQLTDKGQMNGAILVWQTKRSTPAVPKFARFQLYDAINTGDSVFRVTRVAYGTMPYVLQGRPVPGRAVGDQLGQLAIDKPPVVE